MNEVSDRFLAESSGWAGVITQYASWLFWTLVVISMVWTFGMMALRKADIGEFFAELVRFTIFTGFFWWLLLNGPGFAMDIINSLRTIAAEASGMSRSLNPSTPIDIAFDIVAKAAKSYSITSPIDNLSIFLTSVAILICLAVVAANVLLALINAWVMAYSGIFVLGFGGSRWTSDIAINYFRSVLGIALKLLTITLLVGIAVSIIDGYHASLSEDAPMDELLVIFVVSLVMVILVNSVPNVIAGLIPGGGAAASAGSSFGAGALMGAGKLQWELWEVHQPSRQLFKKRRPAWERAATCPAWDRRLAVAEVPAKQVVRLAVPHSLRQQVSAVIVAAAPVTLGESLRLQNSQQAQFPSWQKALALR